MSKRKPGPTQKKQGGSKWTPVVVLVAAAVAAFVASKVLSGDVSPIAAAARRSVQLTSEDDFDANLPVKEVLARIPTIDGLNSTLLNQDPPIYLLPNFITDDECALLIEHARSQGLERSTTTGAMSKDGKFDRPTSQSRTSNNAWCFGACFNDPDVKAIDRRIAQVMSRPYTHMEHYQLLHYSIGQEYRVHHDFIFDQSQMKQGPREFTFFLYLNNVEEGGETHFPYLNLTVKPVKGAALVWPNTDYPKRRSDRELHATTHAALPVIKGEKFAANKWIHKGDFLEMWTRGVSG